jgi:hypothetical protein
MLEMYAAPQDEVIVYAGGCSSCPCCCGVEQVELRDGLKFESWVQGRASDAD